MISYTVNLYNDEFLSLKRGSYGGCISNAKPLFLLSILEALSLCELKSNEIRWDDKLLQSHYDNYNSHFCANNKSPFIVPYYHMHSSSFYHLVWKEKDRPTLKVHTPSAKYLREHLLYAKLDDELWELLQSPENRDYFRKNIINRYLKQQAKQYGNKI